MSFRSLSTKKSLTYSLYYDDSCPLCLRTVNFIKTYIAPKNIQIISLSQSNLSDAIQERALSEMLLISSDGKHKYGYSTYISIFKLSTTFLSPIFFTIALIMQLPFVSRIGKKVYKRIADNRLRCSINSPSCRNNK